MEATHSASMPHEIGAEPKKRALFENPMTEGVKFGRGMQEVMAVAADRMLAAEAQSAYRRSCERPGSDPPRRAHQRLHADVSLLLDDEIRMVVTNDVAEAAARAANPASSECTSPSRRIPRCSPATTTRRAHRCRHPLDSSPRDWRRMQTGLAERGWCTHRRRSARSERSNGSTSGGAPTLPGWQSNRQRQRAWSSPRMRSPTVMPWALSGWR